jgi:hypothetical protein
MSDSIYRGGKTGIEPEVLPHQMENAIGPNHNNGN